MVIGKGSFFDKLPEAYLAKIQALPGVLDVAPFSFFVGFLRDNRPENQIPVNGTDAKALLAVYREANVPENEVKAWMDDPTGALIGRLLQKKFGWKPGDHVALKAPVPGGAIDFTIRAVMRYDLDNGIYLHKKFFEGVTGDRGLTGMYWIMAKSRDEVQPLTAALEKEFDNAPSPIRAMTEKQWQLNFMQMLGNVKALIGSIGIATAFTLLLITANTVAMSARERRREAALLRILGFSGGTVASFFLAEALLYGLLGSFLGVGVMYGFCRLVASLIDDTILGGLGGLLILNGGTVVLSIVIAAGLAVAAGVIPALGLSRRPIVELLRVT
jgi:putative ABC transport system permease protein